ncbi:uncharacterized protein LOC111615932 [Centruroides sculpturatus]|uniref:uncharacterized protein LOC111615932 n=1 Tax=Centruroides sculpturatus TaxID=218467 RepID=UPI000C6D03A5|nr:uncharacterized protein LOC111615932 [Centruroides sculpturatus]
MSSEGECEFDFNMKQSVGKKRRPKPKNTEDPQSKKQKFDLDLSVDKAKSSKIRPFRIKICDNQIMEIIERQSTSYVSLTKMKGNYLFNKYNINVKDFKFYKKAFDAMNEHLNKNV